MLSCIISFLPWLEEQADWQALRCIKSPYEFCFSANINQFQEDKRPCPFPRSLRVAGGLPKQMPCYRVQKSCELEVWNTRTNWTFCRRNTLLCLYWSHQAGRTDKTWSGPDWRRPRMWRSSEKALELKQQSQRVSLSHSVLIFFKCVSLGKTLYCCFTSCNNGNWRL